jgi:hypothetical protein
MVAKQLIECRELALEITERRLLLLPSSILPKNAMRHHASHRTPFSRVKESRSASPRQYLDLGNVDDILARTNDGQMSRIWICAQ